MRGAVGNEAEVKTGKSGKSSDSRKERKIVEKNVVVLPAGGGSQKKNTTLADSSVEANEKSSISGANRVFSEVHKNDKFEFPNCEFPNSGSLLPVNSSFPESDEKVGVISTMGAADNAVVEVVQKTTNISENDDENIIGQQNNSSENIVSENVIQNDPNQKSPNDQNRRPRKDAAGNKMSKKSATRLSQQETAGPRKGRQDSSSASASASASASSCKTAAVPAAGGGAGKKGRTLQMQQQFPAIATAFPCRQSPFPESETTARESSKSLTEEVDCGEAVAEEIGCGENFPSQKTKDAQMHLVSSNSVVAQGQNSATKNSSHACCPNTKNNKHNTAVTTTPSTSAFPSAAVPSAFPSSSSLPMSSWADKVKFPPPKQQVVSSSKTTSAQQAKQRFLQAKSASNKSKPSPVANTSLGGGKAADSVWERQGSVSGSDKTASAAQNKTSCFPSETATKSSNGGQGSLPGGYSSSESTLRNNSFRTSQIQTFPNQYTQMTPNCSKYGGGMMTNQFAGGGNGTGVVENNGDGISEIKCGDKNHVMKNGHNHVQSSQPTHNKENQNPNYPNQNPLQKQNPHLQKQDPPPSHKSVPPQLSQSDPPTNSQNKTHNVSKSGKKNHKYDASTGTYIWGSWQNGPPPTTSGTTTK